MVPTGYIDRPWEYSTDDESIEKRLYVLGWTKRRKRERESPGKLSGFYHTYNASGIQHPPYRTYMTSPIKTSNSGIYSKNSLFYIDLDHLNLLGKDLELIFS
jgi:hypothetical protein